MGGTLAEVCVRSVQRAGRSGRLVRSPSRRRGPPSGTWEGWAWFDPDHRDSSRPTEGWTRVSGSQQSAAVGQLHNSTNLKWLNTRSRRLNKVIIDTHLLYLFIFNWVLSLRLTFSGFLPLPFRFLPLTIFFGKLLLSLLLVRGSRFLPWLAR